MMALKLIDRLALLGSLPVEQRALAMADFEYTENLQLPYIMANQAQKHITHNEALRMIDALVSVAIEQVDLEEPPSSPGTGARYLVANSATGDWSGHDLEIAAWQDGAWMFYAPLAGWVVYALDVRSLLVFDGSQWTAIGSQTSQLGINTQADVSNRLAVKSDAVFFSHDDVTPGTGDMRFTLNMAASSNTASLMFADNWTGKAEVGLTAGTDLTFKVSSDGAAWTDAMRFDSTSGKVSLPAGLATQHAQVFKGATTQELTPSDVAISNWDGSHAMNGTDLTWDPLLGECAIGRAGLHMISYAVSTEVSAGSARTDSVVIVQTFDGTSWSNVSGSQMRMYNRIAGRGGTAAAWTGLLDLHAGDAVRVVARIEQGTDTVFVDQASLMIIRL